MLFRSDVFEAFVGAIYLDLGMVYAKEFIMNSFEKIEVSLVDDNYKDQLMRLCQVLQMAPPEFEMTSKSGETFCITVIVDGFPGGCVLSLFFEEFRFRWTFAPCTRTATDLS